MLKSYVRNKRENFMRLICIFCIFVMHSLLQASSINDHLNIQCSHITPTIHDINAAFVIRLQEHKDLSELKKDFENHGIPLVEYNKFNILPMEIMSQFCSTIISPYLLTQTLSHLSIYKYCLENKLPRALIIEDHAKLVENPLCLERISKKITELQVPWDIIYTDIDYHDAKTGDFIIPKLAEIPQNKMKMNDDLSRIFCRYGTASYVISQSGMQKILNYFQEKWDNLPYDQILFKIPGLNIYGTNFDIITNEYIIGSKEENIVSHPKKIHFPHKIGEEFWIHPTELLSFDRFDILPKYIFAKYSINKYDTNWHIDLYRSHLEKLVKCNNTKTLKIGFDDFRNSFETLIHSIQTKGYDEEYAISVNDENVAWNGAHRIGTCLAIDTPVKVKAITKKPCQNWSAKEFRDTYHLEEKYLDHMAFEYAKLKKNTFVACLYPVGYKYQKKAEKILEKYGSIIHQKDIWLTKSGALEFIRLVYTGEWWTGSYLDDFKHCRGKTLLAFPENLRSKYPVRIYLYECDSKAVAIKAKEELRELCQKGNEVIHINDTHEQTKLIAATLFNANSIEFINTRTLKRCENFDQLLTKLQQFIIDNHLNPEHICVDTSAVLSAYGLRDCVDIDILHRDPLPPSFKKHKIDSHSRYLHQHVLGLDEMLFNPENHFYYNGIKFLKPELIKQMKSNRGSEKDLNDIQLIDHFFITAIYCPLR